MAASTENKGSVDYRALAEFRYQLRRFLAYSEQAAQAEDLEPQQHQMLLAIKGLPEGAEPTVGNLAARLLLRHHSTVELVDRLAGRGLVERRPDARDRRKVLVALSTGGEAALRRLSEGHQKELREAAPQLVRVLKKLLANS